VLSAIKDQAVKVPGGRSPVVEAVQARLAALLHLPPYLVSSGPGATISVTARRASATLGPFMAHRCVAAAGAARAPARTGVAHAAWLPPLVRTTGPSDFLVPSEHPDRADLARGRNVFVSATAFLNTVAEGGHLNFALSDNPKGKQMVKKGEDGRWSFFVQVGVKACATGTQAGGSSHPSLPPVGSDRVRPRGAFARA